MNFKRRWLKWIAAVAVAALAWFLLASLTSLEAVLSQLRGARMGWVLVGGGLSSLALLVSALRLQLAVRAVGEDLAFPRAVQWLLWNQGAGILGGGSMAGDIAGPALGSRLWGKDLERLLAAAPLSRGIGMAGLAITGGLFLAVSGFHGIEVLDLPARTGTGWGMAGWILIALAGGGALVLKRWREFLMGVGKQTLAGAALILSNAGCLRKALLLGIGVQLLQCGALMSCLGAIHQEEFPWIGAAWTFVWIGAASMIPSVLGIGPREAAAALLLAPYGVGESAAIAAGLFCGIFGLLLGMGGGINLLFYMRGEIHDSA
jgi:uncharacterized membrane protein YbhN (UPF0104 family)